MNSIPFAKSISNYFKMSSADILIKQIESLSESLHNCCRFNE